MFSTSGCHRLDFSIHQNTSSGIFEQIAEKYCQITKTFLNYWRDCKFSIYMLNRLGLVSSISSLCKIYVAWPFVSVTPYVYLSKIFKSSFLENK